MPDTRHPKPNTLDIQIINPIDYPDWDKLVLQHEGTTIFHTQAWAKTLYESYNYKPLYFTAFENNGISALLPVMEVYSHLTGKRGVALPFTDYCEPMTNNSLDFHDIFKQIIDHGKKKGWKYLELRGVQNRLYDQTPSTYFYGHTLNLSNDENKIFFQFRNSTQRNIKKSEKEGVSVLLSHSPKSMEEFYRLNCLTRKEHGLPPQPFTFFKNIYKEIISHKAGFTVLAAFNNKTIAGAVFLHHGGKALYKYGASDKTYQNLRANNLIMWEAIKYYCKNGYSEFCFGRTEPENQGLRQFKTGWGTKEHIINYYKYDLQMNAFVKDNQTIKPLYNKIFSTMPIPLLKAAGTLLYKHMG